MRKEPVSNWFLVAFTAALVITSYLQWDAIKDTIKSDEKRFALEQRPYIWLNSEKPNIQANQGIIWNVYYENYGRSTAFNLHNCIEMLVRRSSEPLPLDERFKSIVPAPSFDKCIHRETDENRSLEPPGGKGFGSAISYGYAPDKPAVDFITHSYIGILIVEVISEYGDASGNHYTTTFCDMYSPGGGANIQCPYYNDMK
jgi:hypothetical protein